MANYVEENWSNENKFKDSVMTHRQRSWNRQRQRQTKMVKYKAKLGSKPERDKNVNNVSVKSWHECWSENSRRDSDVNLMCILLEGDCEWD